MLFCYNCCHWGVFSCYFQQSSISRCCYCHDYLLLIFSCSCLRFVVCPFAPPCYAIGSTSARCSHRTIEFNRFNSVLHKVSFVITNWSLMAVAVVADAITFDRSRFSVLQFFFSSSVTVAIVSAFLYLAVSPLFGCLNACVCVCVSMCLSRLCLWWSLLLFYVNIVIDLQCGHLRQ